MALAIHNVLEAACKALKLDGQRFVDGPKPELHNPTYNLLAIWLGAGMVDKIDAGQRKLLREILALARAVAAGKKLTRAEVEHVSRIGFAEDACSDSQAIVRGVAFEARECLWRNPCGKGARLAAAAAARIRGELFVHELRAEILRLEAVTILQKQELEPGTTIVAAPWRGTNGARVSHVVVTLEGKAPYGLIAKTKGRWTWTTGPRDDILASVPDGLMPSAIAAVVGGQAAPAKPAAPASTKLPVAALSEDLCAATIGPDGVPWAATCDDRLAFWDRGAFVVSDERVGKIAGLAAGRGIAVSWGETLVVWRDRRPSRLRGAADGALVTDDDELVTWRGDEIRFGKKTVRGLPDQRLVLDRAHREILVLAPGGVRRLGLDGKTIAELPLGAPAHAHSPDGSRIATWTPDERAKNVVVADAKSGAIVQALKVDSGHIDMVVFASDRVLVRHHQKKRISIFDLAKNGERTHRIQARDLGTSGTAPHELFPLLRGSVLAFTPFPRGETLVVDADAQLLSSHKLERFYGGGKSFLADAGATTFFAHSNQKATRAILF